jgi:hypothetical protein
MNDRWLRAALLAGLIAATPAALSAQMSSQPPEPPDDQLIDPLSAAGPQAKPARSRPASQTRPAAQGGNISAPEQSAPQTATKRAAPRTAAAQTIACTGVFARDSSHLRLAMVFDSRNLTFTEVGGQGGSKIPASVLFPNDPKRRLEVLWNDEPRRKDTRLIAIDGQSTWTGPKGLRLGLPLAAIEKINGKPFKLRGFSGENSGTVTDWLGGALENLPEGCKISVRLIPDSKPAEAANNSDFLSSDAAMRTAKPKIAEILIGY